MILYRHFKKEIHDIIEKDKLLSLAESVVDWKQYSDNRRTADFYEKRWNQEYIEKNKLQNVINFFGETEHLYRYQFLKFNPNSALPYHIDVNRLGAISIPLSDNAAPIEYEEYGLVNYNYGAIINVTRKHRVTNNNCIRYMFQLSLYNPIDFYFNKFDKFLEDSRD